MPTAPNSAPRWRGFNLPYACFIGRSEEPRDDDFRWIADWGFDFVRLPLTYTNWVRDFDPFAIDESRLDFVDRCVELAAKHSLHLCIAFHRAPGYSTSAQREEPFSLWSDQRAIDAFCLHWQTFARRYAGIDSARVSFNLVNEPSRCTVEQYGRAVRPAVKAIHEIDPSRLIVVDGIDWGRTACPELADLPAVHSCRAYLPLGLSHYRARWEDPGTWPEPAWPGEYQGVRWDRRALEEHYAPWVALVKQGVGVHCGEGGCFSRTPHDVLLAWLRDVLEVLSANRIGFALWNLRGSFGVLDSGRTDVAYDEWHGHKLDRKLLELLRAY